MRHCVPMLALGEIGDRRAAADRRGRGRRIEELAAAIEHDQVEILFQPQFASRGNRLVGAEALSRWNHPRLGRIGAEALFDIAERSHHSAELTRHIAGRALAIAARWPQPLRLSLNITATDLHEDDFAGIVVEAAARARFALDDFGAGFCNFRYLKRLPLHILKLDRSMIQGIVEDERDLAVLRGILAMARALDLRVVAEGIETEEQRAMIAHEGCEKWQGFLGGAPMSAAEFSLIAVR